MPRLFAGLVHFKEVDGCWICQDCGEEWDEGQREDIDEVPEFCMACFHNDDYGHGLVDGLEGEIV